MTRNEAKNRLVQYGLTEQEAEELITDAEKTNCEPTSRIQDDWDTTVEFKATSFENGVFVDVYYYPESEELEAAGDDLGNVNWVIYSYEVH